MVWFKVDDTFGTHPKTFAAGNAAVGLWVRAGSWSGSHLTEGFVPIGVLSALGGTKAHAEKLVTVGLWTHAEKDGQKGYQFHDWDERNPSREKVEAEREYERQRKAERRKRGHLSVATDPTSGQFTSKG